MSTEYSGAKKASFVIRREKPLIVIVKKHLIFECLILPYSIVLRLDGKRIFKIAEIIKDNYDQIFLSIFI